MLRFFMRCTPALRRGRLAGCAGSIDAAAETTYRAGHASEWGANPFSRAEVFVGGAGANARSGLQ